MMDNNSRTTGDSAYTIRCDLSRTDYAVTEDELTRLTEAGRNHWRDFSLAFLPMSLSLLLNAFAQMPRPIGQFKGSDLTLSLLLNIVIGSLLLLVGIIVGVLWYKTRTRLDSLLRDIRNKPEYLVVQGATSLTESPTTGEAMCEDHRRSIRLF